MSSKQIWKSKSFTFLQRLTIRLIILLSKHCNIEFHDIEQLSNNSSNPSKEHKPTSPTHVLLQSLNPHRCLILWTRFLQARNMGILGQYRLFLVNLSDFSIDFFPHFYCLYVTYVYQVGNLAALVEDWTTSGKQVSNNAWWLIKSKRYGHTWCN